MIMLKQARLIDPCTRTDGIRDILIAERRIIKIGDDLSSEADLIAKVKGEKLNIIDCSKYIVAPGLVDVHVHLREPGYEYKEDILTGAKCAAAGGFTTIVAMANTKPVVDNEDTVLHILKAGRKADIWVRTCGAVTKNLEGKELVDMKALKDSGCVGFTDDGRPIMNTKLLKDAMRTARTLKVPLSFHEEDPEYVKDSGINSGEAAAELGFEGADRKAEISMIARDVDMALETGATISIQHISTKEGVELVRAAKKKGARVFAEATPHHFSLTQDAVKEYGTLAKMNPPLREETDRLAIIEGIKDGTIDIIATDHAPHSEEEKNRDFKSAPSGIIGLETSLSLGIMNLVDAGHIDMTRLISVMSYEPARLYNLRAGAVKEDYVADVVVFDPNEEWIYENTFSKSKNSPFFNKKMKGKVKFTICNGIIRYEDTKTGI